MIDLRTLGAAEFEETLGSSTRPIAVQAKRLALVAYLALAGGGRYRRRDSVVALFWPELDDEHARGALRQALSYLRRTLGAAVVVTRGEDEIAVAADSLRCDAARFDDSIRAGRFDEAMVLYRGDFLEGLFVSDAAPELEHWIADQRDVLRRAAADAASALAAASQDRGDFAEASTWGRRASALAPDDEAIVRRQISLFDTIGDRAAAVDTYERFARRLASEYSTEPSAETQAFIRAVRDRSVVGAPAQTSSTGARTVASTNPPPAKYGVRSRKRRVFAVSASALMLIGIVAMLAYRGGPPTLHATNTVARDSYVRGRYWWNKRGKDGLLKAIEYFTFALDRDPTFALAYSGIGDAYVQLGYGSLLQPSDAFPKARAAAERALQLDSTLAEPHATLGFVSMYYDWDWPAAERELKRALEANPNYATGHEWYGLFLAAMGRFDEARDHERRAQALEPLSIGIAGTAAWVLYYAGQNEDAERELRIALRGDSSFAVGHFYLGRVYEARDRLDSALAQYNAAGPLRDWVPTVAAIGHVYGTLGRRDDALATLARLDTLSHQQYVTAYGVALVHAALDRPDSAFAWLERGMTERTHWMVWLRRDPRWNTIRADPRFEALAQRLKLPR